LHILVENISLAELEFEVYPENAENLSYGLHVTCRDHYPEDNLLMQVVTFDLMHEIKKPAFKLRFSFISQFRSEGEGEPTLKEFAKFNAPAYVVPYARELVSNVTSRAGVIPTLVIPPINVFALLKGIRDDSEQADLGLDEHIPVDESE